MTNTDTTEVIPAEMRATPRWVVWKLETRDGNETKIPYRADGQGKASSTDPATWCTYDEASAAAAIDGWTGVGFVLGDGWAGVDLDDCVGDTGTYTWGAEIIEAFNTYAEISPSGTGVKLFIRGRKPFGAKASKNGQGPDGKGKVELYDSGRYFTVTGERLPGKPSEVKDCTAELADLCRKLWPPASTHRTTSSRAADNRVERARLYVEKMPAAISGNGGHNATFAVACELHRFALADADAWALLNDYNGRCSPPWAEHELRHKLDSARDTVQAAGEFGCRLTEKGVVNIPHPNVKTSGKKPGSEADQPDKFPGELGTTDPKTGKIILSPERDLPTAESFVAARHTTGRVRTLHSYAGELWKWEHNRYQPVADPEIRADLHPFMHNTLRWATTRGGEMELRPFPANASTVGRALETLKTFLHLSTVTAPPFWIGTPPADIDPANLLPCRNGNLQTDTRRMLPPTPTLFNTAATEFDYTADAPTPNRWLAFLHTLFGDDSQQIELLQEFFGYVLTADTSQQKILLICGPRRSGKGTIARTLTRLVGASNVAGPTAASLAGPFGLQQLIGKSLAILGDARFRGEDSAIVAERLLCISGEDAISIDRKHRETVTTRLGTRFAILSNDLPKMSDASKALAGRFLPLQLTRSFYGCEDHRLEAQLATELPGILLWALDGLDRLHDRGHFELPASTGDVIEDLEDLASPVSQFIRERCNVEPTAEVAASELYAAWRSWCETEGRIHPGTQATFGRDLRSAVPTIKRRRRSDRSRFYGGIEVSR